MRILYYLWMRTHLKYPLDACFCFILEQKHNKQITIGAQTFFFVCDTLKIVFVEINCYVCDII